MWTDSLYRLQSGKEVAVDFSEYSQKKILIANVDRSHEHSSHKYCEYLLSLKNRFDCIVVVIANDDKFQAVAFKTYHPELDVVLDKGNKFISWLADWYRQEHSVETLLKRWNWQLVVSDNSIKDFYDVPVEDRFSYVKENVKREDIKKLYKDLGHFGIKKLHNLFNQPEDLITTSKRLEPVRKTVLCRLFLYTGIWPNEKIEAQEQIQ